MPVVPARKLHQAKQPLGLLCSTALAGAAVLALTAMPAQAQSVPGAGATVLNGDTVQYTTVSTVDQPIVLGADGGTLQTDAGLTVSSLISGPGSLTKTGGAILTLTHANSYAGGTTISTGEIRTSTTGAVGSGPVNVATSASLRLTGDASAESLDITLVRSAFLTFENTSSAGTATITNEQSLINFGDTATADAAHIMNLGGGTSFNRDSSAGNAVITAVDGGTVDFYNNATAGSATITTINDNDIYGSVVRFHGNNTADDATIIVGAKGWVDISGLTSDGIAIGSLSGDGEVYLGSKTLTLGGLGRDETIGGVIQDGGNKAGGTGTGGSLVKIGTGRLVLTGANSYTGVTAIEAGTLAVTGSLVSAVDVAAAGRLEGTGRVGSVTNAGVVAPGMSIGTLTVAGDYVGVGGALEIEAELGGDASPADLLVVEGATSGNTRVTVTNTGGLGGATAEGIRIVDVGGASDGSFTLAGDYTLDGEQVVIAGAYGYRLYKNGVADPQDGDWYLRSAMPNAGDPGNPLPIYQPGVPVYEVYTGALQALNTLPTLQQRVGNRSWAGAPTAAGAGIWGRIEGIRQRPEAAFSTSGAERSIDSWQMQLGVDTTLHQGADGTALIGGLTAHFGTADSEVTSPSGNGTIDTKGYGFGATLTWYGPKGFYVDGQAQLSWFDSDLESDILGSLADGNDGTGQAYSLEVGKRTRIGRTLTITPQVQMSYAKVDFDSFVDPVGAVVSADRGDSLKTRWGLSLDHQASREGASGDTRRTHLYAVVNLSYEWLEGALTDVSGTFIGHRDRRLWSELGVGGTYSWNDDRLALFAEVSGDTAVADFGNSYSLKGNAGFRVRF